MKKKKIRFPKKKNLKKGRTVPKGEDGKKRKQKKKSERAKRERLSNFWVQLVVDFHRRSWPGAYVPGCWASIFFIFLGGIISVIYGITNTPALFCRVAIGRKMDELAECGPNWLGLIMRDFTIATDYYHGNLV